MKLEDIKWKDYLFISILLIVAGILIIGVNQFVLYDYPVCGDDTSYLLQASIFSQGKLSLHSPEYSELYWSVHMIDSDGKFYSKYPFGWPLFLSLGVLIGIPWIINLLFSLGTILLVYLLVRKIFSENVARISVIIMVFNAYFLSFSASYLSHSCTLFFITLFLYIYFSSLKKESKWTYLLLGVIFGVIFNIRPADALALGLFFMISYLFLTRREFEKFDYKKLFSHVGLFLIGFAIPFSIFLLYNWAQTGDPFLIPFIKYNTEDKLYIFKAPKEIYNLAMDNINKINQVFPFLLFFAFIPIFIHKKKDLKFILALFLLFFVILFTYSFYLNSGLTIIYPRYLYASFSSLSILAGYFFYRLKQYNSLIFKIILFLFFLCIFISSSSMFNEIKNNGEILERHQCFLKIENISNAIIFSNISDFSAGSLMNGNYYVQYSKKNYQNIIFSWANYSPEEFQKLKNSSNYSNRTFYIYNQKNCNFQEIKT